MTRLFLIPQQGEIFLSLTRAGVLFPVYLAHEHIQRADPESPVTVQLSVDHIRLARLRAVGYILHEIIVPLEMAVYTLELQFAHLLILHHTDV